MKKKFGFFKFVWFIDNSRKKIEFLDFQWPNFQYRFNFPKHVIWKIIILCFFLILQILSKRISRSLNCVYQKNWLFHFGQKYLRNASYKRINTGSFSPSPSLFNTHTFSLSLLLIHAPADIYANSRTQIRVFHQSASLITPRANISSYSIFVLLFPINLFHSWFTF